MSVYKKLQQARIKLQNTKLNKSGHNKFAGYKYFELGDFLPAIQTIFAEIGLCGVVSFDHNMAYLQINDIEDANGASIMFTSPMSSAALKGCHEVQNLGAVQTYLRRYLWVNALEIVEHDAVDSGEPIKETKPVAKTEQVAKIEKPAEHKPEPKKSEGGAWQLSVKEEGDWDVAVKNATNIVLKVCETPEDVNNIFKVNRAIYDKLKADHKATYDEIMTVFKATKELLTK